MAKFSIQQNRKPWNKGAEWLYETARNMADPANYNASYGEVAPESIGEFHKILKARWESICERYKPFCQMFQKFEISTYDNRVVCINKKHSTECAALVVSMEKEVPNRITAYVIKGIINIKTFKECYQIVGLWGDEDKGEGYRIGPKFAETELEACEKLIDGLLQQYGLPVNLDILIGHFKHEREVANG